MKPARRSAGIDEMQSAAEDEHRGEDGRRNAPVHHVPAIEIDAAQRGSARAQVSPAEPLTKPSARSPVAVARGRTSQAPAGWRR